MIKNGEIQPEFSGGLYVFREQYIRYESDPSVGLILSVLIDLLTVSLSSQSTMVLCEVNDLLNFSFQAYGQLYRISLKMTCFAISSF